MTDRRKILGLAVWLLLAGCGRVGDHQAPDLDGRQVKVVATTGQVADLVSAVGGQRVLVQALMGPGIDPHLYKASARDVERLRQADIIFYNGLHLEAKMGEVIEMLGRTRPVLAVAEAVDPALLLSPEGLDQAHDPHIWFDVQLWRRTVPAVAEHLAALDPGHADGYRRRAGAYAARLDSLHAYATESFASIPAGQRVLITAHDAFAYLGRAYGLQVRGLQGISTASEAGTRDVQDLAAFITARRIPALFVETSVSPRAVAAVREAVRARGFEVTVGGEVFSDALGDPGTPAGTYLGMVGHNVDTITSALRGEGKHEQH